MSTSKDAFKKSLEDEKAIQNKVKKADKKQKAEEKETRRRARKIKKANPVSHKRTAKGVKKLCDKDLKKIIALTQYSSTAREIANYYGVSVSTLDLYFKDQGYVNFKDFQRIHRLHHIPQVKKTLYNLAMSGNMPAIKMLLNNLSNIVDNPVRGNSETAPRVMIIDEDMTADSIKIENDERAILFKKAQFLTHQWNFLRAKKEFVCLVAGYGAGKTHSFLRKILLSSQTRIMNSGEYKGKSSGIVIYPTHKLAKALFWNPYLNLLSSLNIDYTTNVQNNTIETAHGLITVFTAETPEKIIGVEASYIGFDELDRMKKAKLTWENAVGRLRGSDDPQIFCVTTPEGFGFTYDTFVKEPNDRLQHGKEIKTEIIRGKTKDNPYLDEGYIERLKDQIPSKKLEAYLNGEFVNLNGLQAVYEFDRAIHTAQVKQQEDKDIYIGLDFNVDPLSAIVFHAKTSINKRNQPQLDYLKVFRSISLRNSHTRALCKKIIKDYPDKKITFIVDRSGNQRHTNGDKTDVQILKEYGFNVVYLNKLSERDKLNNLNREFERGTITISNRATHLIEDLERCVTDQLGKIDKSDKERTHQLDALGYSISWLLRNRPVGTSYASYKGIL